MLYELVDPSTGTPATQHETLEDAIRAARTLPEAWYITHLDSGEIVWSDANEYRK